MAEYVKEILFQVTDYMEDVFDWLEATFSLTFIFFLYTAVQAVAYAVLSSEALFEAGVDFNIVNYNEGEVMFTIPENRESQDSEEEYEDYVHRDTSSEASNTTDYSDDFPMDASRENGDGDED